MAAPASNAMRVVPWLNDHFEEVFSCVLMSIMVILICAQVVTRYLLETALAWSEELARYMFIWIVYVGISFGIRKRRHLCVDAAHHLIPKQYIPYFDFLGDLLFLFFALFITNKATEVFLRIMDSGQNSPACELPMWIVYGALPFGMALSSLRLLQNILARYKALKQPRG